LYCRLHYLEDKKQPRLQHYGIIKLVVVIAVPLLNFSEKFTLTTSCKRKQSSDALFSLQISHNFIPCFTKPEFASWLAHELRRRLIFNVNLLRNLTKINNRRLNRHV